MAVDVFTKTGAFADQRVGARKNPVEMRIVVGNRFQAAAKVAEHLADLLTAGGQSPLGKQDLCILGEQVENAAASGGDTAVVEGLEVFQGDRFALLVGHCQGADHGCLRSIGDNENPCRSCRRLLLQGHCRVYCKDLM
ncbi:hypothetical protein D3C76_1476270 [compost metagenome]